MTDRPRGIRLLARAFLAVGALAGCGLKGPLTLPEKPGDVTIRPGPAGGTPAGPTQGAKPAAPAGPPARSSTDLPAEPPPPLPPSESDATGG